LQGRWKLCDREYLKKMGNEFKIKSDVKLRSDGSHVYIEYDKCFAKKITSRAFPTLINKNEWQSEGVELLGLLNLLERTDDIDPFYMFRGDVAEHFVGKYVAEIFGNRFGKENVEVIIFGDKQFTYGDQWHYDKDTKKGNKDFGGRMDIGVKVTMPDGTIKIFIIEVKSKTHTVYNYVEIENEVTGEKTMNTVVKKSDYQTIAVEHQYPDTETYQGRFLANMGNQAQVTMFWVFFNDKQEQELRDKLEEYQKSKKIPQLSFDYQDVVYHSTLIEFNRDEIWRDMLVCSSNLKRFANEKKIPRHFFNNHDMAIIEQHIVEYERIETLKREEREKAEQEVDGMTIPISEDDLPY